MAKLANMELQQQQMDDDDLVENDDDLASLMSFACLGPPGTSFGIEDQILDAMGSTEERVAEIMKKIDQQFQGKLSKALKKDIKEIVEEELRCDWKIDVWE